MSDLFNMLHTAFVLNSDTGEVIGMVTGVDTSGPRMRVKVHIFEDDEAEDDDPDDGEKEDIPEEPEKVADADINEKIHMLKTGTDR